MQSTNEAETDATPAPKIRKKSQAALAIQKYTKMRITVNIIKQQILVLIRQEKLKRVKQSKSALR